MLMPLVSKYSNQQIETILHELVAVLDKHKVSTDLALICLGDLAANIVKQRIPPAQQAVLVEKFNTAFRQSVLSE